VDDEFNVMARAQFIKPKPNTDVTCRPELNKDLLKDERMKGLFIRIARNQSSLVVDESSFRELLLVISW
jgi:hypothetical protein